MIVGLIFDFPRSDFWPAMPSGYLGRIELFLPLIESHLRKADKSTK
jgi:hypothetical protein